MRARHDVHRVGGHEILRQVRRDARDARGDGRSNRGVREIRVDQRLKFGNQLVNALGSQIKLEQLDGHQLVFVGVVGAKNRAERSCADLMKNTKRTEGFGLRDAGSFRGQ